MGTSASSGAIQDPPDSGLRRVGRPLLIESPEEFERLANVYFAQCDADGTPPTITGLALGVGLSSRQSLDRYGERPEFRDVVKRAKLVVEHSYELRLLGHRPVGAIFALKNMGWLDGREVTFKGGLANIDLRSLPDALLERIARGEHPLSVLASAVPPSYQQLLPPGDHEVCDLPDDPDNDPDAR